MSPPALLRPLPTSLSATDRYVAGARRPSGRSPPGLAAPDLCGSGGRVAPPAIGRAMILPEAPCTTHRRNLVLPRRFYGRLRGFRQLEHGRVPGGEDSRDDLAPSGSDLIPMRLEDLLQQSMGAQQAQL